VVAPVAGHGLWVKIDNSGHLPCQLCGHGQCKRQGRLTCATFWAMTAMTSMGGILFVSL
jgi:hypothetical protein